MIKAVVWDVGGVLIGNPKIDSLWQNKGCNLRNLFGTGKITKEEFIRESIKILKVSENEFLDKYNQIYSKTPRIEKVINIYKKIKVDNFILTDTNPIREELINFKTNKIYKIAKKVFLSYELKLRKNDFGAYERVIAKIGYKPEEILVIDDKEDNLEKAKFERMKILLYKNPKELKKELFNLGLFN